MSFIRYSPFKLSDFKLASENSLAHFAISKIRKFLRRDSPQIANPQTFMINSQIANTQISKKILHNFVSKQS
jgi:hypothetical protein